MEMSVFFTSGCDEETDGEQGIKHTTAVTNDAATEQGPDRVEGQISASGLQLQRNVQLRELFPECFVSRTPNALLRQNPQPWTNAWFDHVKRTQEMSDEPHNQRTWRASQVSLLGQSQKIKLETRRLSRLQPELPHFPSSDTIHGDKQTKWHLFRR